MRIEPLGQDRYHRTFWHFDVHRDTHDIVLVHDPASDGWLLIDSVDDLQALRNKLNVRGLREKKLRKYVLWLLFWFVCLFFFFF